MLGYIIISLKQLTSQFVSTLGPLNSEIAKRALVQCTDIIVKSNIDLFVLYSNKSLFKRTYSEDVFKIVNNTIIHISLLYLLS